MSDQASLASAQKIGRPNTLTSLAEMPRLLMEMSILNLSWGKLARSARRGNGEAVMVLPGFMGGDDSTLMLRRFLTRQGFLALPWLQGQNLGNPKLLQGALRRVYRMHSVNKQKISLIGQSLGGVFAREIAREIPHAIRSVITLGSPFGSTGEGTASPMVERMFESLSGLTVEDMRKQLPQIDPRTPLGLPSTAIYSRSDGVVAWRTCLEQVTELSENIEVTGSHTGMAMNQDVLYLVAHRLAEDPNNWQKFDRKKGCRSWVYPEPAVPPPMPE